MISLLILSEGRGSVKTSMTLDPIKPIITGQQGSQERLQRRRPVYAISHSLLGEATTVEFDTFFFEDFSVG